MRVKLPGNGAGQISEQTCAVQQSPLCQHSNDVFSVAALDFVSAHNTSAAKPFFLMWTPTAPHAGLYQPTTLMSSPVRRLGNRIG
jgi:hypothetical protein